MIPLIWNTQNRQTHRNSRQALPGARVSEQMDSGYSIRVQLPLRVIYKKVQNEIMVTYAQYCECT